MYFIEHLCDMAQRENHLNFVRMVQKDIFQVVDAVAPSDGAGAANVKVVRRVCSPFIQNGRNLPLTVLRSFKAFNKNPSFNPTLSRRLKHVLKKEIFYQNMRHCPR